MKSVTFFMWSEKSDKSHPSIKIFFQLENVHGISLKWWGCVLECLFLLWNQYLVCFRPLDGLRNFWKNFLSKSYKSHPSKKFFFHLEKVHEISLRWWFGVHLCLFLHWDEYLVYFKPLKGLQRLWKNFLSKSYKSHPSFQFFSTRTCSWKLV